MRQLTSHVNVHMPWLVEHSHALYNCQIKRGGVVVFMALPSALVVTRLLEGKRAATLETQVNTPTSSI